MTDDAPIIGGRTVTYRFWVSSVLASTGVGAGLLGEYNYLIAALPFAVVLVLSYLDGWWPHPETISCCLDAERAIEGDEINVIVTAVSVQPLRWLEMALILDDGLTATAATKRLDHFTPKGPYEIEAAVAFRVPTWGVRGPRALAVTSQDRFGMTAWQATVPITATVRVHPPTAALQKLIPLRKLRQATGEHGSRLRGHGTELAEVRDAHIGDLASSIHPRLSGRRRRPVIVDRHPDRSGDVVLLIDATEDIGRGNETSLSWAVQAALSVNYRHQRGMDRVGLIDWGGTIRWLNPGLGRRSAQQVVDALLHIQTVRRSTQNSASRDTGSLPINQLPRGCLVLALSSGLSEPFNRDLVRLRHQGHHVVVVQPALGEHQGPSTVARIGRILHEQRRRDLIDDGVDVVSWDPERPLSRVLASAVPGGRQR